jgi:hypothetical protein
MTAEGIVRFFVIEGVLFCLLMLGIWGIKKVVSDGELAKWITIIVCLVIGGTMLIYLLRFAGIF